MFLCSHSVNCNSPRYRVISRRSFAGTLFRVEVVGTFNALGHSRRRSLCTCFLRLYLALRNRAHAVHLFLDLGGACTNRLQGHRRGSLAGEKTFIKECHKLRDRSGSHDADRELCIGVAIYSLVRCGQDLVDITRKGTNASSEDEKLTLRA